MKTVLITGTSSGYGLETARYFHDQGWKVIATMRRPQPDLLPQSDRMSVLPLDVTNADSIAACLAAAGPIDVLVNNAGIGMVGAFEASPMAQVRRLFETNTFGVMAMIQAILPMMRQQGGGVIVNVTSSVVLSPSPFAAAYTATKTAIEGFSRSLAKELVAFDIGVKMVEPGYAPTTRFGANVELPIADLIPPAYADFARPIFEAFAVPSVTTREIDVAEAVWRAANDTTGQQRFPAGPDAVAQWEASR
ncbi:SDR family oxidoreductase [Devosia faecipullorum]|jgi:NAD(P)-dependent dehydrogenase (short-subunit alcohol dehydrogenase family)|uniref:SDR family oxidoreductase n=1 Tax=Devosia faecipullorum TaxID=2755039 RepID=UPI00187B4502|nr:SDR family oxidoreductase [Devosia faecipullorum]MBE7734162.1 SDR family oxidoreductase [Devosia faecipullorum]